MFSKITAHQWTNVKEKKSSPTSQRAGEEQIPLCSSFFAKQRLLLIGQGRWSPSLANEKYGGSAQSHQSRKISDTNGTTVRTEVRICLKPFILLKRSLNQTCFPTIALEQHLLLVGRAFYSYAAGNAKDAKCVGIPLLPAPSDQTGDFWS